ncbi:MAG: protein kinase family protein [Sporichthyaceae bacterium]
MPPNSVEPGTRLVDRYRLEAALGQAGSTSYWRAQDELLDRPVGLCLLDGTSESAPAILSAARQAAAVTDPRFLRVLDASETDSVVYVVTEWVAGSSLADLLADGPLPPAEARSMVAEIAQGLAAAHEQGLAHLCLRPEQVLRMAHGQVKVAGLAVDAAVRGLTAASPEDAARRDAEGCAAILYAALTARWPSENPSTLPPAPRENGVLCTPRQVRAGVPDDLDEIASRTLINRHRAGARPLNSPAEIAAQLAAAHVTTRLPVVQDQEHRGSADTPPPPSYLAPYEDTSRNRRGTMSRAAWALAALILAVGLGLAAWQAGAALMGGNGGDGSPPGDPSATQSASGQRPLKVAGIAAFDPPPGGNGEENDDRAPRVLDGDTATVWTTKTYREQFGPSGLKEGVGLLLDLGKTQSMQSAAIALRGTGTDLELRVADQRSDQLADYKVVAQASGKNGLVDVRPDQPVRARYVLVWLTALPSDGSGYRGEIAEISVRG